MEEITDFIDQYVEQYTIEVIEDDVVNFYNDTYMLLQYFLDEAHQSNTAEYKKFINHIIINSQLLKEYTDFDFSTITDIASLKTNNEVKQLSPIFTPYSFNEIEEMIDQIFEELKVAKEFQKELKEEIKYILEEYVFHLDHLEENMKFNFYTYDELNHISDDAMETFLEDFRLEKKKFIQGCNDRLNSKK